jgi:uncharacterized membrane protein YeaQ/YmgE (transglycosylase-associated protein family)
MENHMDVISWVTIGALVGWLASIWIGPYGRQGVVSTMLVGMVGGTLGGLFLDPVFGAVPVSPGEVTLSTLAMPFVGGVILVAAVWFYRRNFT